MSSNYNREYVCGCGFSQSINPRDVKGHWLSPDCPECPDKMEILPSRVSNFNKGKGSLGKGKRFHNPDGDVARSLKGITARSNHA